MAVTSECVTKKKNELKWFRYVERMSDERTTRNEKGLMKEK